MNDAFAEVKAQIENENTLDEEVTHDRWEAGDPCGRDGCGYPTIERHFPKPESEVPDHESYSEYEFVCPTHGIRATR